MIELGLYPRLRPRGEDDAIREARELEEALAYRDYRHDDRDTPIRPTP